MKEDWIEKIEASLKGEMSPEEQLSFESELATNPELFVEYKIYRAIENEMLNDARYSEAEVSLKNSLEKLNAVYFQNPEKEKLNALELKVKPPSAASKPTPSSKGFGEIHRIKIWKKLAVAAGIIGIIVIGITWYLRKEKNNPQIVVEDKKTDSSTVIQKPDTIHPDSNSPSQNQGEQNRTAEPEMVENERAQQIDAAKRKELFANNFKPDEVPKDTDGPLEDAFAMYENAQYNDAIKAIENADLDPVRGQETDAKLTEFYARYYKALSYLANGKTLKAIPELEKATVPPNSPFRIKVKWYLALAYLERGDIKKAEVLLRQIAGNEHAAEYKSRAETLIKEINKK